MFSNNPMPPSKKPQAASFSEAPGHDTIAAIATGHGGGIGIVRVSGPRARAIARRFFRPARKAGHASMDAFTLVPHRLHYGQFVNPRDEGPLDEILLAFMPGPNSYTCEDVVEFQCHGGPEVLKTLLRFVLEDGARLAEAGEFTRRAFLNGRIDLSQVEAVADIVNADSEKALMLAARQLGGALKRRVDALAGAINDLSAGLEAGIEFPDELGISTDYEACRQRLRLDILAPIERMIESYQEGRRVRNGLRITIAGRPNVGKSSLLNRLVEHDKAIVAPLPGTTRDPVEACISVKGHPIVLCDTAGIHPSDHPVEAIGIQKSIQSCQNADLVLFMIDATETGHGQDAGALACIGNRPILVVVNKMDLVESKVPDLPDPLREHPAVFVSALEGTGLSVLRERILSICTDDRRFGLHEHECIAEIRHKDCLEKAHSALRFAEQGLVDGVSEELICMDLNHATRALEALTGAHVEEDVLSRIFERFCVGK